MLIIFDFTVQSSWIKQTTWVHIEATHHWISFHDKFQTNNDTKQRKRTLQSSFMGSKRLPASLPGWQESKKEEWRGRGGGGRRRKLLFSPPHPPSIFHFFCPRYNFRAITRLGTLASQAYYKEITHHLHGKRRRWLRDYFPTNYHSCRLHFSAAVKAEKKILTSTTEAKRKDFPRQYH